MGYRKPDLAGLGHLPRIAIAAALISGCSTDQLKSAVYNVGHGNLCVQRDRDGEGALGMEPCDSAYKRYEAARTGAIEPQDDDTHHEAYKRPERTADAPGESSPGSTGTLAVGQNLDRCWESKANATQNLPNDLLVCVVGVSARMTIHYSNKRSGAPPTKCYLDGPVRVHEDRRITIAMLSSGCRNGNDVEPVTLSCTLEPELLRCTDVDRGRDVDFEPRGY